MQNPAEKYAFDRHQGCKDKNDAVWRQNKKEVISGDRNLSTGLGNKGRAVYPLAVQYHSALSRGQSGPFILHHKFLHMMVMSPPQKIINQDEIITDCG